MSVQLSTGANPHRPPMSSATATAVQRLVQQAGRVCADVLSADPRAWRDRTARHVLDWLGCAASGARTEQGLVFARWLHGQGSGEQATLAEHAGGAPAAAAAAFHGALGSALEMDDVHRSSVLHPGPVVIPAALAACSARTSGADFLDAVLFGYEITIRIGQALGPTHYRYWHTTATAGAFGAAAAAAAVLKLDAAATAHALALAGTRAGGLWQVRHENSLGKAWHMAGAARDGLAAAQLAAAGLTGPLAVLEGPSGWFAATAPGAREHLIDQTRATPWIDDVSFKPWPACRHAHPAMDALRELLAGQAAPLRPVDVEHITVHAYADALRFCDCAQPQNSLQARFSIQHALAAWLHWGEPQLAHFESAALTDTGVAALRGRISLVLDAEIEARYPAQFGARVELTCQDGRHLQAELHDTYGDPARPMSPTALQDKARLLMRAAGWPAERAAAALLACANLPTASSLQAFNAVLAGAT